MRSKRYHPRTKNADISNAEESPLRWATQACGREDLRSNDSRSNTGSCGSGNDCYMKIAIFAFNLMIWFSGGALTIAAVCLLKKPNKEIIFNLFELDWTPLKIIHVIGYALLGLGFIALTIIFIDYRPSLFGNQTFGKVYLCMIVPLIISEVVTSIALGIMTFRAVSTSDAGLQLSIRLSQDYGHDPTSDITFSYSLDFVQYKFRCCGIYGDGDYSNSAWWRDGQISGSNRQVPLTCCLRNSTTDVRPWFKSHPRDITSCEVNDTLANDGFRHKQGCLPFIMDFIWRESISLVCLDLSMAAIQAFAIFTHAVLFQPIKETEMIEMTVS